jgi:hypothetical protein
LKYGIKNVLDGGNWYVATVTSILYLSNEAAVPEIADLTQEDFHVWTAGDATGEMTENTPHWDAGELGTSTDKIYGSSTVNYLTYANLDDCTSLAVTVTAGQPRVLFNRVENEGALLQIPNDPEATAKYQSIIENGDGSQSYVYDLEAIKADYGFVHLHSIKGANWSDATATAIQVKRMTAPIYATTIGYTRTIDLGYTAEQVPYNEEEIFNTLGVTSWDGVEMYPILMTTGEPGEDFDGWRNVEGDPTAWNGDGTDLGLCLKYPHDGGFALCTHPGKEPEAGTVQQAGW